MVIAILALQGAFIEHEKVLKKLNVDYFEIRKKDILIEKIVPENDISLADGLIRSAVFSMIQRGITEAFYSEAAEEVIKKTGFVKDLKSRSVSTEKLFISCKDKSL